MEAVANEIITKVREVAKTYDISSKTVGIKLEVICRTPGPVYCPGIVVKNTNQDVPVLFSAMQTIYFVFLTVDDIRNRRKPQKRC